MKIKNKGKVHPSPSSTSSDGVILSVLQLLPAAILALASVLSLEDREVLAYMITRSMKTSPSSTSSDTHDAKKKSSKKSTSSNTGITHSQSHSNNNNHRPPMFDCECFDCYRSYWFRWDSSPNRELIHQAIEAFEDHLANGEKPKKNAGRGKRRDKMGRRGEAQKPPAENSSKDEVFAAAAEEEENVVVSSVPEVLLPVCDVVSAEKVEEVEEQAEEVKVEMTAAADDMALVLRAAAVNNHKGLARKVLPDVLGLFNSRLWNLWSPNA